MPRQKSGNGRRALATNIRKCKKRKVNDKIDNTERRNKVVLRDLGFWLAQITRDDFPMRVREKVKMARTPDELWKLGKVHQAYVLTAFIQKYRKGRSLTGARYPNSTL